MSYNIIEEIDIVNRVQNMRSIEDKGSLFISSMSHLLSDLRIFHYVWLSTMHNMNTDFLSWTFLFKYYSIVYILLYLWDKFASNVIVINMSETKE